MCDEGWNEGQGWNGIGYWEWGGVGNRRSG